MIALLIGLARQIAFIASTGSTERQPQEPTPRQPLGRIGTARVRAPAPTERRPQEPTPRYPAGRIETARVPTPLPITSNLANAENRLLEASSIRGPALPYPPFLRAYTPQNAAERAIRKPTSAIREPLMPA